MAGLNTAPVPGAQLEADQKHRVGKISEVAFKAAYYSYANGHDSISQEYFDSAPLENDPDAVSRAETYAGVALNKLMQPQELLQDEFGIDFKGKNFELGISETEGGFEGTPHKMGFHGIIEDLTRINQPEEPVDGIIWDIANAKDDPTKVQYLELKTLVSLARRAGIDSFKIEGTESPESVKDSVIGLVERYSKNEDGSEGNALKNLVIALNEDNDFAKKFPEITARITALELYKDGVVAAQAPRGNEIPT